MRHALLAAFVPAVMSVSPIVAQHSAADFVGTWELVSIEVLTESGDWVPSSLTMDGTPVGLIMYDDKGNIAVQITTSPRSEENPPDIPEIVNGWGTFENTKR